jgi:hypothetical protein
MDKVDGLVMDKTEWIKLEFFTDLDNQASKYSEHIVIFKDSFYQMVDVLLEDWEPDALDGTYWHDQDIFESVEVPSLILLIATYSKMNLNT